MANLLRHWLTVSLSVLVGIPVLIVTCFLVVFLVPHLDAQHESEFRAHAYEVADRASILITASAERLERMANDVESLPKDDPSIAPRLDALAATGLAIETLYLLDDKQKVRYVGLHNPHRSTRANFIGLDFSGRDYVRKAVANGGITWSDTFLSPTGEISVAVAVPRENTVYVAELSLFSLSKFVRELSEREGITAVIADHQGAIVAHPVADKALQHERLPPSAVLEAALAGKSQIGELEVDNLPYVGISAPVEGIGWVALALQSKEKAFAGRKAIFKALFVSAFLSFAIALAVALLLARLVNRRISEFGAHMQAVANGDYLAEIPRFRITELNDLADSMRRMALSVLDRESKLKQREMQYREVVEGTDDLILRTGQDGAIRFVNPASTAFFGLAPEQSVGRSMFEFVHPDDLDLSKAFVDKMVSGRHVSARLENRLLAGGESPRLVQWNMSIEMDENKRVVGLTGIARDITAQKYAEQQLNKFYLAVEQSPESIIITDLAARIEYVNRAFVQTSGYAREEVIGRNPRMLQTGKTPASVYRSLWETLGRGAVWQGEFINRTKGGEEYIEAAIVCPIRSNDGSVSNYLAIKADVTAERLRNDELELYRNHLEEQVQERTKELKEAELAASSANVAKSAFLANMSHEIRTPLTAIIGMAQILQRGEMTTIQKDRLGKINVAAQHLLSLINDILDLSKIEAGKVELEYVHFDADDFLANVKSIVAERARNKGLDFRVEKDPALELLYGDPTRMQQALLNYLGNAIKFTENGSITLRAAMLRADENSVLVRFEVQDTGVGIAENAIGRLFNPFEQEDKSTTRKFGGTGLGLAITRRIAELMGGDVGVSSVPGKGSTFWISVCLPKRERRCVARQKINDATTAQRICHRHPKARVLVVDDEPINVEIALFYLEEAGLVVDVARDGVQAIQMASENQYALILMDMQMPQMGGIESARRIRHLDAHLDTPILAVTANAFSEHRAQCFEAGMSDFITKPFLSSELLAKVLKWLDEGLRRQDDSRSAGSESGEK